MKDNNNPQEKSNELLTIDDEIEKLNQEYSLKKKDFTKLSQKICLDKSLKFIIQILTLIVSGAILLWLPTSFIPKILLTITTLIVSGLTNFKIYKHQKKQEYKYEEMLQTITGIINQITDKRKERKSALTYKVSKITQKENKQPRYNYTYTINHATNSHSHIIGGKRNSLKLVRKKKMEALRTNVD